MADKKSKKPKKRCCDKPPHKMCKRCPLRVGKGARRTK